MRLLFVAIILLSLQNCTKENKINSTSVETFEATKKDVSNNLSEAEKTEFNKAINIIEVGSKRIKSEQPEKYGNMTDREVALLVLNNKDVNETKKLAEEYLKKQKALDIKTINDELKSMQEQKKTLTESKNIDKSISDELEFQLNRITQDLQNAQNKSEKISDWQMVNTY